MRRPVRTILLLSTVVMLSACGDAPFAGLGDATSDWINEPTIPTTTTVVVTIPVVSGTRLLGWFNDGIVSKSPNDPVALRREIFNRGAGELIVQASRAEISAIAPDVKFPSLAPVSAEYVTSQLVFDGDGSLSSDPLAGFGIWSSVPYTRSRSVAQIVVIWVSSDEAGATEVAESPESATCVRFASHAASSCEVVDVNGTRVWSLDADNGTTLIWYDGNFRYELFGRSSIALEALTDMIPSFVPIGQLEVLTG